MDTAAKAGAVSTTRPYNSTKQTLVRGVTQAVLEEADDTAVPPQTLSQLHTSQSGSITEDLANAYL